MILDELSRASDKKLLSILAEADAQDELILERQLPIRTPNTPSGDNSLEVVILGSLGCRFGMLKGEAGGFLLRTAKTCILVDPGPSALYFLSQLEMQGQFTFADLDVILCSHIHTDHTANLLPCIEGMTGGMKVKRGFVIGNRTVIEKFMAFSPYHLAKVKPIILIPEASKEKISRSGHSQITRTSSNVVVNEGMHIWATPTFHLEEEDKWDTGLGFIIQNQIANLWYTGDTNTIGDLTKNVKKQLGDLRLTLVIANADASDIEQRSDKGRVFHLLTRDVVQIAKDLKPRYIVIQHYDEAYSSPRYRIAQAVYIQRIIDRDGLETIILPSTNGISLSFNTNHLYDHKLYFQSNAGSVVKEYVQALTGEQKM